ncbi:MAG TPA: glycine--tRNA ligase [Anaerolineae bacterium]|nr:glycine--tRNA ligase [Anaerolineae bacterium]
MANVNMETIVSLCKRRGFVFQGSEIYGGIGGFWDYGPLGVELKNNIKRAWWRAMVQERDDIVGIDAAIIMNPLVWKASGHVDTFTDPLVECKNCHHRFRADQLKGWENPATVVCPNCGQRGTMTEPRQFNLLFKTRVGPVEDDASIAYLRPETAQAMFVQFRNVQESMRKKLPFGIAQIGRSFRNEIVMGNFIFRDREFEQMEMEFFVKPGTEDEWHDYWKNARLNWWKKTFRISDEHLRVKVIRPERTYIEGPDPDDVKEEKPPHYSKGNYDLEYKFPMGWSEIEGIASRTNYDLSAHQNLSGKDLTYFDDETKEKYIPYVVEPAMGVDRAFLAALFESYREEQVKNEKRVVLAFPYGLAPYKAAVFPLLRNRPELVEMAHNLSADLKQNMMAMYDDTGAIGKLYRRQDEIGTPFCITVDVQSLDDHQVTIRDRDSMQQVRVEIGQVKGWLLERVK